MNVRPRRERTPCGRTVRPALPVTLLAAALIAGGGCGDDSGAAPAAARVRRGEFRLTVEEPCEFRPLNFRVILARAGDKLEWIAPEGTEVKTGDLVFALDRQRVTDWLDRDGKELESAAKNLDEVKRQVQVEAGAIDLGISERECAVTLAEARLAAATAGAAPEKLAEASAAVQASEVAARDRSGAAEDAAELASRGFISAAEAEETRTAASLAEIDLELVKLALEKVADGEGETARRTARLQLERARVELALSKTAAARQRAELDARVAEAQARVASLERSVANAKAAIVAREARSPADGTVIHRELRGHNRFKPEVGTFVWEGAGIADVADLSRMKIRTQLSERYIRYLKVGDVVTVRPDTLPQKELRATVTWIDRWSRDRSSDLAKADRERQGLSGVKVFALEAALDSPAASLRPGFKGTVSFALVSIADSPLVPAEAVFGPAHDRFVLVLQDGTPRRVPITVVAEDGVQAAVAGELEPGQALVSRGSG